VSFKIADRVEPDYFEMAKVMKLTTLTLLFERNQRVDSPRKGRNIFTC